MAHFAEISPENDVLRVLVVPDDQEHRGQEYLAGDLRLGGTWLQTSYNNNIRGRYAAPGMLYHAELDLFIEPQPYASWTLDSTGTWQPPVPMPDDGATYSWQEETQSWVAHQEE